jgi:phage tail-like protein
MPPFAVNPTRIDPYKQFKFRVKWDGVYVAGISRVGGLRRVTDVVEHREGGDVSRIRRSPGITRYEPITLERGVTHDPAFEKWAQAVWNLDANVGEEISLRDFRKDVLIELLNEAGQVVLAYRVFRCWPSMFVALPDLDANVSTVAIQTLTLENEGWIRDFDVAEPAET